MTFFFFKKKKQTGTPFYACPSTGETTWDAPVGHFVYVWEALSCLCASSCWLLRLPPSAEGEWWELHDETRGGIPYYYHTKLGETTWEKPDGFVIPLGVIQVCVRLNVSPRPSLTSVSAQNTSLGRRLSQSTRRHSHLFQDQSKAPQSPRVVRATVSRGPPSPISEKAEDVTASGSNKEDRERHRAHRTQKDKERDKVSSTPPRPPSRTRTKSSPHIHGGSQSLTAAVEYIAGSSGSPPDGEKTKETVSAPDPRSTITKRDRNREDRILSNSTPRSVSSPLSASQNSPLGATDVPVRTGSRRSPLSTPPSAVANGNSGGGWRARRNTATTTPLHISSPVLNPGKETSLFALHPIRCANSPFSLRGHKSHESFESSSSKPRYEQRQCQ